MVVVREEIFEENGIERKNKQRVKKEQSAREQRAKQSVKNNRVDTQQPLYRSNRPSVGGGSFGPWMMLVIAMFAWTRRRF